MTISSIDFKELVSALIEKAGLDARNSAIINGRFGLDSDDTLTLQELGKSFNITRERVRQLESQSISDIREALEAFEEKVMIPELVSEYLKNHGGIRKDEQLVGEFHIMAGSPENSTVFGNRIRFLFEVLQYPYFSGEDNNFHDYWYSNEDTKSKMEAMHADLVKKLKRVEHFEEIFNNVISAHDIVDTVAALYLSASKRIGVGPYGDIGLSEWEEVNPKTVRAKAFILLKRSGSPLHFTDIAAKIGSHAPTVHNELIKDQRFMLVGRGTYGLRRK